MSGRAAERRWRYPVIVGTLIYAAVLLTVPFEHHDLACHLKTPQHCTSCSLSPLGSRSAPLVSPGASDLADAGRASTFHSTAEGTLLPARTTGRSPPHAV